LTLAITIGFVRTTKEARPMGDKGPGSKGGGKKPKGGRKAADKAAKKT
jgi:hypothetical protein